MTLTLGWSWECFWTVLWVVLEWSNVALGWSSMVLRVVLGVIFEWS